VQKAALDHLLNPVVMKRITNSESYGNGYGLADVMGDLTEAVFEADAGGNVNTHRQNLQVEYVKRLAAMARSNGNGGYHTPAVAGAVFELQQIRELIDDKRRMDRATRAHVAYLDLMIERALSRDV
jgi:hypothetical protein